jgi:hypothetical protein
MAAAIVSFVAWRQGFGGRQRGRRASTAAGESVITKGFHVRLRCGVDRPTQGLPVPLPVASVGHGRGDPHDQVVVDPQQVRVEQVVKVGTQEQPVGHDVRRRTVIRLDMSRLQSLTSGNTTDGAPTLIAASNSFRNCGE